MRELREIGHGSGREVCIVNDEKVAKIAKNEKGQKQNKQEFDMWSKADDKTRKILAKVISANVEDFNWIKMEYCKPSTQKDFKEKFDIEFDEFKAILNYWYKKRYHPDVAKKLKSSLFNYNNRKKKSFWMMPLKKMIEKEPYSIVDLMKLSSWGVTKSENLVLIDYGLSLPIYRQYYKKVKK